MPIKRYRPLQKVLEKVGQIEEYVKLIEKTINPAKRRIWINSVNLLLKNILTGLIIGIIGAMIIKNKDLKTVSNITFDSNDKVDGHKSTIWTFDVQPSHVFNFGISKMFNIPTPTNTVLCQLHLQMPQDTVSINLSDCRSINFQAKSNKKKIEVSEFNLFSITDTFSSYYKQKIQYIYNKDFLPLQISNKWNRYSINLKDFTLAGWNLNYEEIDKAQRKGTFNYLKAIYAFGFDMKTDLDPINGKIWIDDVYIIKKNGLKVKFSEMGDSLSVKYQGKVLNWVTECGEIDQY